MNKIQMVDLKSQYLRLKSEIDSAIQGVINSTSFINGKEVKLFENELAEYLSTRNVITCGNGTDALQVALMALDLKPGDEVITSNFSFISVVEVIALLGLKPILVDPDPQTFNITSEAIERAITNKTKAIIPVHLFGQCSDIEAINKCAEENGISVIEDTAQALGANFTCQNNKKKAGTMGTIGTASFFPSKNLGCYGDGGALFTDDDSLASKIRSIVNHGMSKKYYHALVGVNSRLDTLQAAILRVKLKYLNKFNMARHLVADKYDKTLGGIPSIEIPSRAPFSSHIFHQYTIKVSPDIRDSLKEYLSLRSIPTMIYYPLPLHKQNAYKYLDLKDNAYPVSKQLAKSVLSLPMHNELSNKQLEYICIAINEFFEDL